MDLNTILKYINLIIAKHSLPYTCYSPFSPNCYSPFGQIIKKGYKAKMCSEMRAKLLASSTYSIQHQNTHTHTKAHTQTQTHMDIYPLTPNNSKLQTPNQSNLHKQTHQNP